MLGHGKTQSCPVAHSPAWVFAPQHRAWEFPSRTVIVRWEIHWARTVTWTGKSATGTKTSIKNTDNFTFFPRPAHVKENTRKLAHTSVKSHQLGSKALLCRPPGSRAPGAPSRPLISHRWQGPRLPGGEWPDARADGKRVIPAEPRSHKRREVVRDRGKPRLRPRARPRHWRKTGRARRKGGGRSRA